MLHACSQGRGCFVFYCAAPDLTSLQQPFRTGEVPSGLADPSPSSVRLLEDAWNQPFGAALGSYFHGVLVQVLRLRLYVNLDKVALSTCTI